MSKIIIGVSSSIALYKTLDLISRLKKDGHEIYAVLTKNARKLVSQQTFNALAGTAVDSTLFNKRISKSDPSMKHIDLSRDADLFAIIPATANISGKLAAGIADDLLSTLALSVTCQKIIAPAMNPAMWGNAIVRRNVKRLRESGYTVIEPDEGVVACGDVGAGRLRDISIIYNIISSFLSSRILKKKRINENRFPKIKGKKFLITAGGSVEMIDPVRYIGNRSSGRMGAEIAEVIKRNGGHVFFFYGNISVPLPVADYKERFFSAEDLHARMKKILKNIDVVVMAAAIADFKPEKYTKNKIKKKPTLQIKLKKTLDILKSLDKKKGQYFIGFAAETENHKKNALKKLEEKNLDLIIMNPVGSGEYGIDSDKNKITIYSGKGKPAETGVLPKNRIAEVIIEHINRIL
ncbi:bifunctional phosphopantothenoylcysteine decarboxylase/phosphopantothenate--cysteine ligase CoaBC [Spirochaetota bacterium]